MLNLGYNLIPTRTRRAAHDVLSGVFRGYAGPFSDGEWRVYFAGRRIVIPLRGESAWLDWDFALSVLGHDSEITELSSCLIRHGRPRLVLDVGSNYGVFSIRWLVHGIRTISFEPNPVCNEYLRTVSRRNGVTPCIEEVALGAEESRVTLSFPPGQEWLGTTRITAGAGTSLRQIEVEQWTVDGYCHDHNLIPGLLKVDTEGSDLAVLRGASQTLMKHRPLVLFESLDRDERDEYRECLVRVGYSIWRLARGHRHPVSIDEFAASRDTNFLACPSEMPIRWPPVFTGSIDVNQA
jgi:FkbM family methyltransferase